TQYALDIVYAERSHFWWQDIILFDEYFGEKSEFTIPATLKNPKSSYAKVMDRKEKVIQEIAPASTKASKLPEENNKLLLEEIRSLTHQIVHLDTALNGV